MRSKKEPARERNSRIKTAARTALVVIALAFCLTGLLNRLAEENAVWKPDYPKVDLSVLAEKEHLTDAEYHFIFLQTGLAREAADELLGRRTGGDRVKALQLYQDYFFAKENYKCRTAAVIVHDERLQDGAGNMVAGFGIPDLRNGDILITKSTHSLGWRHGHAAIVTDAADGETLEAVLVGKPAATGSIYKWRTYTSYIQLRLRDHDKVDPKEIAVYAKKTISGVSYGLLAGIPEKAPEIIKKTQCAHLVWYPYEHFGYDLDSDGSWLVTPKDIANSDLLEVVQVFGVNPEEIWK